MFIWYFLRKKKLISHTAEKKKQNLFTLGENVDKVNNKHTNEQTLIFQGNFHGTNNSSKIKTRGEEEFRFFLSWHILQQLIVVQLY